MRFVSFAVFDAEGGRLQVSVVERQRDQLSTADAGGVERFQDGAVRISRGASPPAWLRLVAVLLFCQHAMRQTLRLRQRRGLTQTQLAARMNTTQMMMD